MTYDLCQDIWAGYPATTSLSSGFDSSMVSLVVGVAADGRINF